MFAVWTPCPRTGSWMVVRSGPTLRAGAGKQELLTVDEVIAELRSSRATFYRWRQVGRAPTAVRLPNGGLLIPRAARSDWGSAASWAAVIRPRVCSSTIDRRRLDFTDRR